MISRSTADTTNPLEMSQSLSWPSYWILMTFALTVVATLSEADDFSFPQRDFCVSKETCHECIQTPECAWCSQSSYTRPRCFSPGIFNSRIVAECSEEYVYNPDHSLLLIRNPPLTKDNSSAFSRHAYGEGSFSSSFPSGSFNHRRRETVQISPQELKLSLRLHDLYNISFSYARAEDFPVDVYYITSFKQPTDNNYTNVIDLGNLLVESVRNVTSNFRWGFGSTVSYSRSGGIERIYGFEKITALSQNTTIPADPEHNLTIFDNPAATNGSLDTILKAIVCRNQIGWRSNSKKLLVFATDTEIPENISTLSEAVRRTDEQCHFSGSYFSAYSTSQGHPTISQINRLVRENGITIIWAVTNEHYSKFERLARYVEGSIAVRLSNGSTAIPALIREQYQSISSSVEIRDTAVGNVKVKYYSSCLEDGALRETARCDRLKVGTNVQFIAKIEATECPANKLEWHQQFHIYPVGVGESLAVDLNIICDCDCENPSNYLYERHSQHCMGVGTLKCGLCECDDGYMGRTCELNLSPEIRGHGCMSADNTASIVCSGRGICISGTCECFDRTNPKEMIYGPYCECDNFSCDRTDGLLCSNHGSCACGQCTCNHGWSGPACSRAESNSTCIV